MQQQITKGEISSTLIHQLCQIHTTLINAVKKQETNFASPIIQKQIGGSGCGLFLFAISFALHAALGHSLSGLEFKQLKMRRHLLKCLTARTFTPFPTLDECSKRVHPEIWCIALYLMPDTYGSM